jgi:hypothetical protein
VGEQEIEYKVHETLLSKRSEFFSSAAKEEWKEGREGRVPLPDDTLSVVDLYIQWIYTGGIVCPEKPTKEDGDHEESKNGHHFYLLIGGFVFGEKVQPVTSRMLSSTLSSTPSGLRMTRACAGTLRSIGWIRRT